MMERKKAFPHNVGGLYGQSSGMDLRDYFAAAVMQALITASYNDRDAPNIYKVVAKAYQIADTMMKERGKS